MATFDSPDELRSFLTRMHDEGEQTTLPFIDAHSNIWLTCAIRHVYYAPPRRNSPPEGLGCWIVGAPDPRRLRNLDEMNYPVVMLVEPEPEDPWKCPRCGDWFTGHSKDRPPICDRCLNAVKSVAGGDISDDE